MRPGAKTGCGQGKLAGSLPSGLPWGQGPVEPTRTQGQVPRNSISPAHAASRQPTPCTRTHVGLMDVSNMQLRKHDPPTLP